MRSLSALVFVLALPLVSLPATADDICKDALKKFAKGIRDSARKAIRGEDWEITHLSLVNVNEKTLDYRMILTRNKEREQLVYNVQLSNEDATRCLPYASEFLF